MQSRNVNRQLRGLSVRVRAALSDAELLDAFCRHGDGDALAALVERHGPMVWSLCRRMLGHHDAEDAFQATFLVLVRKASAIRDRTTLANWLFGVARQTAVRVRVMKAKQLRREQSTTELHEPGCQMAEQSDILPLLDEELAKLPEKHRLLIVLCDLEGRTRREVALQLGCPEGTIASRLARARVLLAKRLAQRGLAVSGGALASMLSAPAVVPAAIIGSTIRAVTLVASGKAVVGVVSTEVVLLMEGMVKTMLMTKLKLGLTALLLVFGMAGMGVGLVAQNGSGDKNATQPRKGVEPAPTEADLLRCEREKFVGTWETVSEEANGEKHVNVNANQMPLVIQADGIWKFYDGDTLDAAGKTTIELNSVANRLDLKFTIGDGTGDTVYAIYEFVDKNTFRMCATTHGKDRPTKYATSNGDGRVLSVYRRLGENKPMSSLGKPVPINMLQPGGWSGASELMVITADGSVSYSDQVPVECKIQISHDASLIVTFPATKNNAGKPTKINLRASGKEFFSYEGVVGEETFRATAYQFSPEIYTFRLEIFLKDKLVAGARQFYIIPKKVVSPAPTSNR